MNLRVRLRAGDPAAFGVLFEQYAHAVTVGPIAAEAAVLQRALVAHTGQIPG